MAHTFTDLLIHVVFGTKDRIPMISDDLKNELYAYMGGILREIRSSVWKSTVPLIMFTCW